MTILMLLSLGGVRVSRSCSYCDRGLSAVMSRATFTPALLMLALAHLIPVQSPSPVWVSVSIAMSVFAILIAGIVEHVQRRVPQGRQVAETAQELAFDDASPAANLPGHPGTARTAGRTLLATPRPSRRTG